MLCVMYSQACNVWCVGLLTALQKSAFMSSVAPKLQESHECKATLALIEKIFHFLYLISTFSSISLCQ